MKKLFIVALALALTACGALAPAPPPTSAPPPTAQIVIATVLVPITVTSAPTVAPSDTPAPSPTPQVIVVTATGQPAPANTPASAPAGPTAAGAGTATATLPSDAGGLSKAGQVMFSNLTRSGSFFSLRCAPQDINFGVSTANQAVTEVDLFYRFEDLTTVPTTISEWKNLGKMVSDKNGNYTLDVNTSSLSPDLRTAAKAWFDYQFVGIAKDGNSVGNSGKISQQILYLKDCPA